MPEFGELTRLDPREVWPREDADFTPWLAENIGALGDALGMELELIQREAPVGVFSLDLLAEDLGGNRKVVIENQITPTDHDHLGKLLTYAAGFDAKVVVWVAKELREEHRQALDWLNQRTDSDTEFFGVVVEILKIDESLPAHNFKPVVFPNEWQKQKRSEGHGKPSAKGDAYRDFFQGLIDELREKHRFTKARAAQPQSWYAFTSGIQSGIVYATSFTHGERVRAELYIDPGDADANKELFDALYKQREALEAQVGEALEWERLDDKRASRIAVYRAGHIHASPDALRTIRAWAIERLLKFKAVFGDRVRQELAALAES